MEFRLREILIQYYHSSKSINDDAVEALLLFFEKEAELYGEFLLVSERLGLKALSFKDYKKYLK